MSIDENKVAFPASLSNAYQFYQETQIEGPFLAEKLVSHLLINAFHDLGVFLNKKESYTLANLREKIELSSEHHSLFEELIEILAGHKYLIIKDGIISSTEEICSPEMLSTIERIVESKGKAITTNKEIWDFMEGIFSMIFICLINYPDLLKGKKKYHQVMFPSKDFSLLQAVYSGNQQVIYGTLMAEYVEKLLLKHLNKNDGQPYKIIEVGAGTGGSSLLILNRIKHLDIKVDYCFTDISRGLLRYAQREFSEIFPFVEFRKLDVSEDIESQNFEEASVDLVICQNVLHATPILDDSMIQISKLLRPKGTLLINEMIRKTDFTTCVFGLTPEWWNAQDNIRIEGSPLLIPESWLNLMNKHGFETGMLEAEPPVPITHPSQGIFIGEKRFL